MNAEIVDWTIECDIWGCNFQEHAGSDSPMVAAAIARGHVLKHHGEGMPARDVIVRVRPLLREDRDA